MALITRKFLFTGIDQITTIPAYVPSVNIKAWGAAGGSQGGLGGPGGYSEGVLTVVTGQTLTVIVGQGGTTFGISGSGVLTPTYGGGGAGGNTTEVFKGSQGGGRSAVRLSNGTEVITAGGGGGSSSSFSESTPICAGPGGGTIGFQGFVGFSCYNIMMGKGGTQVAGGAGGSGWTAFNNGSPGLQFAGGAGGGGSNLGIQAGAGGGGGGGFFGGGGGAGSAQAGLGCPPSAGSQDVSGGGGSGFIGGVTNGLTLATTIPATIVSPFTPPRNNDIDYVAGVGVASSSSRGGNGLVVLSFTIPDLITVKRVDKTQADVNSTLVYTITINNTGLVTVNDVIFIDTIPTGTTFVANSMSIDGAPTISNPNPPGITIPSLKVGVTTIVFSVKVGSTVPTPNPIANVAFSSYTTLGFSSNTVRTTINTATLSSSKSVNKSNADVGDILTYTIPIINTGSVTANNVVFIDTIPNGTSLVSLTQNGSAIVGSPNPPGVSLNNIAAGAILTVVMQLRVDTIPNPNPIPNVATTRYSYIVDSSTTPNITSSGSTNTNTVTTQVNNANLGNISKGTNRQFSRIGDIITYTITIPNTGNVTATNVIFKDTIPNGTTFVPNSVVLNGTQQNGLVVAPPTGLTIGSIAPNSTVTLSFQVLVNTIPSPNPIPNSGNVGYNYTIDPVLGTTGNGSKNTNIVSTTINSAVINSTKQVTPTNTTVGETIFYTIILTNSGNATANNITFVDTIPNDTTFVPNSFAVNGTTISGVNPNSPGISISNIAPGGRATITFRVTINTIPNPNPIPNSSYTNYNFVVNTITGQTAPNTSLSNTVSTFVNPDSNPLKIADKQYAKPGDIITYTVQWQNRLNVTATDVTFLDTIPNDTSFIPNSFTINGVTIPGANPSPPTGVNVGTIPSQVYTTVTFQVRVDTVPNPNPIPNQAYGRYSYVSDTILGTVTTETAASNIVTTQVNYASIPTATKQVNRGFAKVGDILTYTISFTNMGNTTATNIKLIDTIPNGTSFNINSVFINGTNQPGLVVAPPTGLSVGSLAANATATVVFTVTVDTVPSPNPIPNRANVGFDYTIDPVVNRTDTGGVNTNIVNTTINYANIGIIGKTVDKAFANTSDSLLYIITIRNTGNVTANNVILRDTIPNNTSFINGSVLINGAGNATVPTGNILQVNMGNLAPNGVASLTFRVQINGVPNPNPIPNSATANYTYTVDPSLPNGQSASNNTNIVNTQVNNANLGGATKFVDKVFAICGETITYTISIPNSGNTTAVNVILNDTVPNGTVYVPNSILVNGVQSSAISPISIPIGNINPGATTTISFSVTVQC